MSRKLEAKPRVVIVGSSFAGLSCARSLRTDFNVTLVDMRDYFEYSPGILRLFVNPEYLAQLCASTKRFQVCARPILPRRAVLSAQPADRGCRLCTGG